MKQILQNLGNGDTTVEEVPAPKVKAGALLIATRASLISAGTERMLLEFGKGNLIQKARQQPDKVRMVLDKVRTDGLAPTIEAVTSKLDEPLPLGYCNAGVVIDVGDGVNGFSVGDRVASNGKHAEIVNVPANLCARIPDKVDDESAAFTVIGAIALQGIRLAQPTLGEAVVVTGLGLIGLMAVQILRANGCRVLGLDYDADKLALAQQFGAETFDLSNNADPLPVANTFSRGRGVDAVLITASTKSNEPVSQAAKMCRKRGRIVLVGVTGLELSRADFYEKELSFRVSCSYGPGRYDPEYEEKGHDYPVAHVRWTEQRNFEAVLDLLGNGSLDVRPLISHRFPMSRAGEAYALLSGTAPYLGIVLTYPDNSSRVVLASDRRVRLDMPGERKAHLDRAPTSPVVGFIGAGNYAGRVLMPAFRQAGAQMQTVATSGGVSAVHFGKKHGFAEAATDAASVIADDAINTVVIATRHDTHASFAVDALKAGKHVFVEKPLALSLIELEQIETTYAALENPPLLMVGFNRRFAPQVKKIKELLDGVTGPKAFIMTVNAGEIPPDHWTQDPAIGGGRIVGEACHFVDLLRFLADAPMEGFQSTMIGGNAGVGICSDKASFTLRFSDGSIGTVHYLANGSKSFPKERLEVFCAGRVLQLDNFRKLTGYGWPGFSRLNLLRQDKGQKACVAAFVDAVEGGKPSPIPFDELIEVSRITIEIAATEGAS